MPKDHARKNALRKIKQEHGVPHTEAIAILDEPEFEFGSGFYCEECGATDKYDCDCQFCEECGGRFGDYGCNCSGRD